MFTADDKFYTVKQIDDFLDSNTYVKKIFTTPLTTLV